MKKHRKQATVIWILLLLGFAGYVAYIIWETIESRKDPASSIELKVGRPPRKNAQPGQKIAANSRPVLFFIHFNVDLSERETSVFRVPA